MESVICKYWFIIDRLLQLFLSPPLNFCYIIYRTILEFNCGNCNNLFLGLCRDIAIETGGGNFVAFSSPHKQQHRCHMPYSISSTRTRTDNPAHNEICFKSPCATRVIEEIEVLLKWHFSFFYEHLVHKSLDEVSDRNWLSQYRSTIVWEISRYF